MLYFMTHKPSAQFVQHVISIGHQQERVDLQNVNSYE